MGGLAGVPPELLALPAFALAAGVDLYLMLLFLGVAPAIGWWPALPGALGDLHSTGVLVMVGSFYVLEFAAERAATPGLVWNAFHAIIRPLAGALVGLLLLDGQPGWMQAGGAVLAGAMTAGAHAASTGGSVLLWLTGRNVPNPLLVSILEDVAVVGLVVLALDHPPGSLVVAALLVLGSARVAPSQIRAFAFAVRMAVGRAWKILGRSRWLDPEEFPGWVRDALADDALVGGLRGCPAAALSLPGTARFVTGWIVVRGDTPAFLDDRTHHAVDLGRLRTRDVVESGFYRRIDLTTSAGESAWLYLGLDGPGRESLRAEFMSGTVR